MKIAVIPNAERDAGFETTKALCRTLGDFAAVYAAQEFKGLFPCAYFLPQEQLFVQCDIVVTLGGDGTLLAAAGRAAVYDKPVLGINMGRLGFLTGSEKDDFFREGFRSLENGFETEKRMMIKVAVTQEDGSIQQFHALNDIVVTRTSFARIGNVRICVGDDFLGNYLADGVLVSTPTGSTGYSLSAGGPIVDPELEAMVVTPICPHMLHARPIVIPPTKTVTIEKTYDDENDSAVTADGKNGCVLRSGEKAVIKKSELYTRLIKTDNRSFYKVLREKLQ